MKTITCPSAKVALSRRGEKFTIWSAQATIFSIKTIKTMNTPETKEIFKLYRTGADMTSEREPLVATIKIRRDELADEQLRDLIEACNQYGGGASISHPRYTRQLSAAKKFLENAERTHGETKP